ncbi:2-keto-4-pentenoate hydratase [Pandoraea sp. NPDC087047]|uniref:2-keto-4-pentenoate hydratase n=1 Tax=Pandoraea sp. NPDC087047 TaxID=3364390 RepID=UPI00381DBD4E
MFETQPAVESLARLLADTRRGDTPIDAPADALLPVDANAAYAVQLRTLDLLGDTIAAWKVGAKAPSDLPNCAPIPASVVSDSGGALALDDFFRPGLELEIAFRLSRDIKPGRYDEREAMMFVGEMLATIEITDSRFSEKGLDSRFTLADLQNNGALVIGSGRGYDAGFNYLRPKAVFTLDGKNIAPAKIFNTGGDPRALLTWLVNHNGKRGMTMRAGAIVTCGSYVGMIPASGTGELRGTIDGVGEVAVTLK